MRDHSGSKVIHLMGIVSCLCLIPRLFHDDREEDKEDSEFLEVVRSNQFENMVLVSLALAVPSVLDMLADILEKRSTAGLFDDAQLSRIVLAVSLLSQPLLLYHFAIQREDLIATYAAKNFRAIACGTVVVEQLYVRCSDMFTIGRSSLMLILSGTDYRCFKLCFNFFEKCRWYIIACLFISAVCEAAITERNEQI
jgi:hypothetical protein